MKFQIGDRVFCKSISGLEYGIGTVVKNDGFHGCHTVELDVAPRGYFSCDDFLFNEENLVSIYHPDFQDKINDRMK